MKLGKRQKINECIQRVQMGAKKLGVELDIKEETFIDDDHLNCVWYDGELCSFHRNGYTLSVEVCGDVVIYGKVNGEEFSYINRSGSGAMTPTAPDGLRNAVRNDAELCAAWEKGDIAFSANNWIEVFTMKPDGSLDAKTEIPTTDNVLEACSNVLTWMEILK